MSTSSLLRTRFPSDALVAVGLAAGFGIAQGTGIRALGGAVFAAAGLAAGALWLRRRGPATAVALASATFVSPPPAGVVALGEIGLSGELRRVRDQPQRLAEAARLGFTTAVVPATERRSGPTGPAPRAQGMRVIEVPDVMSALRVLHLSERTKHALEVVEDR